MECSEVLQALTEPDSEKIDEAKRHAIHCPACLSRFDQFARAILSTDENEISCAECRDQLPAYHEAEKRGEQPSVQFTNVAGHLARCPYCADEYLALKEAMAAWEAGNLPRPVETAPFDVSFLDRAASRPSFWITETAEQVARFFIELRILISRERASFAQLPGPLTPQWAATPAFREKAAQPRSQTLSLPAPEHDISLSLTVGPVSGDETAFSVQITRTSSGQPLSRARVTVRDENRRLLISDLTREDGRVTFPHIGSGTYLVEVKHQGKVWELPMTFALEEESARDP